uniref:Uncharacterized protein n=1 Tax=Rhizophora mucronata TaxID=61149 RepID=A0A2P2IZ46_RHIMU
MSHLRNTFHKESCTSYLKAKDWIFDIVSLKDSLY